MIIKHATTPEDFHEARELILEYAKSLDFDLDFQQFDRELDGLSSMYGGANSSLLLALVDDNVAGTVAVRPFDAGRCEMKRMWVRPQYRSQGVARRLAEEIIAEAKTLNYQYMLLDTTARMRPAITLYKSLGFVEIDSYTHNPIEDAKYFCLNLRFDDESHD